MEYTGIYERLITQVLHKKLETMNSEFYIEKEIIDSNEAAIRLSAFLSRIIYYALESIENSDDRLAKQIEFSNSMIKWIRDYINESDLSSNLIDVQGMLLTAFLSKNNPIAADFKDYIKRITPVSGLTQSELFTGNNAGISLETEFKREILSADSMFWLVSFIKWQGIRIFRDELEEYTRSGRKLNVITTSYMGATDPEAVQFLASLPNTEIKVSYNTSQERLHAKSYLFLRNTGYDTGYIGSANISRSALTNGLEWNIKITTEEIPHIIKKCRSTFKTYWESPEFENYHADDPISRDKLKKAISVARGEIEYSTNELFFDIEPLIHQKEMLEKLTVERDVHNRWKNLIVAATGTGKTVISAFDFKRFYKDNPNSKLLYVAHREEILKQALLTFRGILRESNFGDLWVGTYKPERYDHLFISVQTMNSQRENLNLSADYYDFIIVDEVHHIAADSYRTLLSAFSPKILLGLTATPERHDGANILDDFCGTIAAELRLPDAINRRFLCPFQYFAVDDNVDLSHVSWERGKYDPSELTRIYLANDQRCKHILRSMQDIIGNINRIKALGFCVSQEHAKYMADKFILSGVKAAVLTSENAKDRDVLRQDLIQGRINVLFVVDIFNEGVDIPEIDTVLFLRPTESLTIFLQQLGRGLRLADGKECLTVLDFVGNARPEYDFSQKFRAMVGKTHLSTIDEIEKDFPHLPLGCSIVLQKRAREIILNNIRSAIINQRRLLQLIRSYKEHSTLSLNLTNFLSVNPQVTIEDIYKSKIDSGGGWSRLCINAGVADFEVDNGIEQAMYRGIANRILQCTSTSYLQFIQSLLKNNFQWNINDSIQNQMALMVHYDFWQKPGSDLNFNSLEESINAIGNDKNLVSELREVLELVLDRIDIAEYPMMLGEPIAINLHARYSREQILSAFGENRFDKKSSSREGLVDFKERNIELFFVTLQKTDKKFSPTTLYHDYAISETLFHWQSQNSATPEKGRGLSYVEQSKNKKKFILFVREQSNDEYGRTMGFVNLGPVIFESYSGSKPMSIIWRLENPMPAWMWKDAAKLAIA